MCPTCLGTTGHRAGCPKDDYDYPEDDCWLAWERDTADVFPLLARLTETCPCEQGQGECAHRQAARAALAALCPIMMMFGGVATVQQPIDVKDLPF